MLTLRRVILNHIAHRKWNCTDNFQLTVWSQRNNEARYRMVHQCDQCDWCVSDGTVSASSPAEERLRLKLMKSRHHNLLTIPVSDVGESVQVRIGIMLQKVIQVVRIFPRATHSHRAIVQ